MYMPIKQQELTEEVSQAKQEFQDYLQTAFYRIEHGYSNLEQEIDEANRLLTRISVANYELEDHLQALADGEVDEYGNDKEIED